MVFWWTIPCLLVVSFLWGATNPFIRLAGKGIEQLPDTGSRYRNLLQELHLIGKRWRYWIPFLLNQAGSVLYVCTLQSISMSVAVPVANSLSFVFTAISGYFLGEKIPGKKIILGTLLICLGSAMIIYDQSSDRTLTMEFNESTRN